MEKAVVTGALGFIGFHLCHRLLEEGIEVAAIDDFNEDRYKSEKEERLNFFGRNALFTLIDERPGIVDLHDALNGCDVFFHLCAVKQMGKLRYGFDEAFDTVGLTLSSGKDLPFLVFLSSTEVYGSQSGEVKESAATLPATSRAMAYLASEAFFEYVGFPLAILRMCEVYGPLQPAEGSIHQLVRGKSPKHHVDDILYIDDAVEAMYLAAEHRASGTFNIASGGPGRWTEAKHYLSRENKKQQHSPGEEVWYSIEKSRKSFGYEPKVLIKEGICRQSTQMD